jgi:hypothetical protein
VYRTAAALRGRLVSTLRTLRFCDEKDPENSRRGAEAAEKKEFLMKNTLNSVNSVLCGEITIAAFVAALPDGVSEI